MTDNTMVENCVKIAMLAASGQSVGLNVSMSRKVDDMTLTIHNNDLAQMVYTALVEITKVLHFEVEQLRTPNGFRVKSMTGSGDVVVFSVDGGRDAVKKMGYFDVVMDLELRQVPVDDTP